MTRILLALLAALLLAGPTRAAVDESELLPIEDAFALTATATERGRIEFHWKIAEGYYLYKHRMGVQPASSDFKFNPLQLPDGKRYTDEFFGEVETYRGDVTAVLTGAAADGVERVEFRVKYQGCADIGICYPPHTQSITVALPADTRAATLPLAAPGGLDLLGGSSQAALPEEQAFRIEAIIDTPERLLVRMAPAPGYYLYRDKTAFAASGIPVQLGEPQWPAASAHRDEHFGDVQVYFESVEVPLPLRRESAEGGALQLRVDFQGCQTDGICYPPMQRTLALDLPAFTGEIVRETPPAKAPTALWLALLLALGGGLILNLMPCVLPVLSLKALALAESGHSRGKARAHALWYTAGVLASFAAVGAIALALRQAGLALGWGFQLQQPLVVAALGYVMFAIGLSLSGVVTFGAGWAGAGQSLAEKSGPAGDFFTGVLAVVVASPCTAPFMGTALAFAFTSSPTVAILTFLALGLGLALPFLLIGFVPALASRLPRPGAWMDGFKQFMAFPMYLTAAWLVSVLAAQRGADAVLWVLGGAVVLALGLWAWERARYRERSPVKALALVAVLIALWPLWEVARLPAPTAARAAEAGVVPYSAERLEELRKAGRVVFVNMTADWCVTCKANEKTVLARDGFRTALESANAVYMKGDWTNVDPAITAFLEAHGAVGVPLYVVFPKNGGDGDVLPTVLTSGLVEDALQRAAQR